MWSPATQNFIFLFFIFYFKILFYYQGALTDKKRGSMWGLLPLMMKSLFHKQGGTSNQQDSSSNSHSNSNASISNFTAAALLPPPKHGKSVTIADFDILKPISRYEVGWEEGKKEATLLFL
jgi:hypothetical protein